LQGSSFGGEILRLRSASAQNDGYKQAVYHSERWQARVRRSLSKKQTLFSKWQTSFPPPPRGGEGTTNAMALP